MTDRPLVSFLTDFGVTASAPAVCRGVIWDIAPDARILDITHAVRQFAVRDGAFLLARSLPYVPIGIHLAVIDPGVGTDRRPIGIRVRRGDVLIGPDNGLLLPAAERLGGIVEARVLENGALWLPTLSHTFHGRDLFAPVAAHLANGVPFAEVGSSVDVATLVELELPEVRARDGGIDTAVLFVDTFGNCRLAGETADLADAIGPLTPGRRLALLLPEREGRMAERLELPWVGTFADVAYGEPLLFEDADFAGPALAVNRGSAAEHFALTIDQRLRVEPA